MDELKKKLLELAASGTAQLDAWREESKASNTDFNSLVVAKVRGCGLKDVTAYQRESAKHFLFGYMYGAPVDKLKTMFPERERTGQSVRYPHIRHKNGRPFIENTDIPVVAVWGLHRSGTAIDNILNMYNVPRSYLLSALAYGYDRPDVMRVEMMRRTK